MKIIKRKNKKSERGYFLALVIGRNVYESYWSSPPETIDHVGLEYLKNRYPIITTKLKADTFKELYKNLWVEVTPEQKGMMRHCVGLNYKNRPYRNYYCIEDCKEWNDLVDKGLAIKHAYTSNESKLVSYHLTKQGVEFLLDKSISQKVYENI